MRRSCREAAQLLPGETPRGQPKRGVSRGRSSDEQSRGLEDARLNYETGKRKSRRAKPNRSAPTARRTPQPTTPEGPGWGERRRDGKHGSVQEQTMMEQVLAAENVREAWRRVKANAGAPGIDGMSYDFILSLWFQRCQ